MILHQLNYYYVIFDDQFIETYILKESVVIFELKKE